MLQPRLAASKTTLEPSMTNFLAAFNTLTLCSKHAHLRPQFAKTSIRYASHAAQGRANGPKDSAGRRLGAKKGSQEYVIPGNIIFKQRGTKWFPGENVGMGKDHTIYATEYGYVRYYKNPAVHAKRRYIGVALEKEGPGSRLPSPPNAPSRRRLGMYASPMKDTRSDAEFLQAHLSADSFIDTSRPPTAANPSPAAAVPASSSTDIPTPTPSQPTMKAGAFWPSNYEVGQAAEKKGIVVKDFDRKDRWLAWRNRTKKTQEKLLARAAKATRKNKGKKSNKGSMAGVPRK